MQPNTAKPLLKGDLEWSGNKHEGPPQRSGPRLGKGTSTVSSGSVDWGGCDSRGSYDLSCRVPVSLKLCHCTVTDCKNCVSFRQHGLQKLYHGRCSFGIAIQAAVSRVRLMIGYRSLDVIFNAAFSVPICAQSEQPMASSHGCLFCLRWPRAHGTTMCNIRWRPCSMYSDGNKYAMFFALVGV